MNALPVLETLRLRLRPRTLDDLEDCFAMDREPGTLEWVTWPGATGGWHDRAAHRAFIRERTLARYPAGMGYWIIARRERPTEFLGWVLLIPENAPELEIRPEVVPEVEIGWRLPVAARGHGYAAEAARAVLGHGLDTLALPRIVADIRPENAASIRVAERIGMRDTGPLGGPLDSPISRLAPHAPPARRYVATRAA